jgi:hypothetical protein
MTLLHDERPVARKAHRCGFCGERIEPGTRYHRQDIADDGRRYAWKAHLGCDALTEAYAETADCYELEDGIDPESVREWLPHLTCAEVERIAAVLDDVERARVVRHHVVAVAAEAEVAEARREWLRQAGGAP